MNIFAVLPEHTYAMIGTHIVCITHDDCVDTCTGNCNHADDYNTDNILNIIGALHHD